MFKGLTSVSPAPSPHRLVAHAGVLWRGGGLTALRLVPAPAPYCAELRDLFTPFSHEGSWVGSPRPPSFLYTTTQRNF